MDTREGAPILDAGSPPAPRPTISTVAKAAAVSRQTVSNVLNAPHRVRTETRLRVEAAIAEVDYRPLKVAQALRTGRSHLIGLSLRNPGRDRSQVLDAFFHALTAEAQAGGSQVMLATSEDDDSEIQAFDGLLGDYDVEGLVLTGTHVDDRRIPWLTAREVPFVTFGRPWGSRWGHAWVDVDGAGGVRAATTHLIGGGHERVAFIGWPAGSGVGEDRRSGWEQACRTHGVAMRGMLRLAEEGLDQGRAAAASLLDGGRAPSAIACVSDAIALGAWVEVTARGMVPGRDVAITGFDDSQAAAVVGLTSVAQPLAAAATACASALELLRRPGRGPAEPPQVLLAPTLVTRASG